MELLTKIILDFGSDLRAPTVYAKQRDQKSRYIAIVPMNGDKPFEIENGITARIQLTKPDGFTVFNDCAITDGEIRAELTAQILSTAGLAIAEIGLYKDDSLLSSQTFYIDIKKSAFDSSAPESSAEFNALIDATNKAEIATEAAENSATDANNAAKSATVAASNAESAATAAETSATAANNAEKSATTAATAANEATDGAEKVNISAEQTPTGATITVTDRNGVQTPVHIDTLTAINSWEDVKNAVRLGLGAKLFPVGYEFSIVELETGTPIVWVVRAHDHHKAANNRLEHTMTLETKNVYCSDVGTYRVLQFDNKEAFYYAETELTAGTYHFTVAEREKYPADNGKSFQFTLTKAIPKGGQIVVSASIGASFKNKYVYTYSSPLSEEKIESTTLTEGDGGTNLGIIGETESLNNIEKMCYGSNNYAQSAVRIWLNSDAEALSVWSPTNKFDRPAQWAGNATYIGFMNRLPADFLAVVQPAIIPCRTNSVSECESFDGTQFATNQVYTLEDKFFILSRPEIYGDWDNEEYKDGEQLEYYKGLTTEELKKYDNNNIARFAWLRSPEASSAHSVRCVNSDGSLFYNYASILRGVAPACIIA